MGQKHKNNEYKELEKASQLPIDHLKFSFEFYANEKEYCLSQWPKNEISLTLKRLQDICSKTFNELINGRCTYHFYPVDWSKTIKKEFPNAKINKIEPFHFSLIGVNCQKARVYGAYADSIFYIVWFDFDHKIWPTFKKNT